MTCLSLTLCKPRISAEGYWRKHEMQVASKKVHWKKNSASPPSNYSEIFNPPPSPKLEGGGFMPWSSILSMAGVLKARLVTKTNVNGDHQIIC